MSRSITASQLYIRPTSFAAMDGIVAGFSTRHGGVSSVPFDSLNLGLSTKDKERDVLENRRRLFESIGFSLDSLAITGQVHGDAVLEVKDPGLYKGYDGLVTRKEGLLLCLSAADCASVLMADPDARVIGACHAGWRGTLAGITQKTLGMMIDLGARIEHIRAYISPCISLENFEVGEEVANKFESRYVHAIPGKEKPHVDLKTALQEQITSFGVQEGHVEVSPYCTFGENHHFYSYRAEGGQTGRLMGFIGMI